MGMNGVKTFETMFAIVVAIVVASVVAIVLPIDWMGTRKFKNGVHSAALSKTQPTVVAIVVAEGVIATFCHESAR